MRFLLLVPLVLMACAGTRLPVTDGRISTLEQFQDTVVGNVFTTRDLSVAIRRNGTFEGREGAQAFSGTWRFVDGQLCVTRTAPEQRPTDCQIWSVAGNAFTVTRNGGQGPTTTYVSRFPLPLSFEQRAAASR